MVLHQNKHSSNIGNFTENQSVLWHSSANSLDYKLWCKREEIKNSRRAICDGFDDGLLGIYATI
jgi:hypothetical protein